MSKIVAFAPLSFFFFLRLLSPAQTRPMFTVVSHGTDFPQKFENKLQVFWRSSPLPGAPNLSDTDPQATLEIYADTGRPLSTIPVVPAIRSFDPAVTGALIYDVSARDPGFIAVAAVYTRSNLPNVAVLLYFSSQGSLIHKTVLQDSEIQSLEIDSAGHVWALNAFDPDNPSNYVFSEFDAQGALVKGFLKPRAEWSTDEGLFAGGQASFGITSGRVWAWLPDSRMLISVDQRTGEAIINQTGFPAIARISDIEARRGALLATGELLMDISWRTDETRNAAWFLWSSESGWRKIHTPEAGYFDYLYSVTDNEAIYGSSAVGSGTEFYALPIANLLAPQTAR